MTKLFALLLSLIVSLSAVSETRKGLVETISRVSFVETVSTLETILKKKDFTIFAKVDHQANAAKVKQKLPASTLFIFGKPQVGTAIMKDRIRFGIDLPVKMYVFQEKGKVKIVFNDPHYLADRHGSNQKIPQFKGMKKALTTIAKKAARGNGT